MAENEDLYGRDYRLMYNPEDCIRLLTPYRLREKLSHGRKKILFYLE